MLGNVAQLVTKLAFGLVTPIGVVGPAKVVVGAVSITLGSIGGSAWAGALRPAVSVWPIWLRRPLVTPSLLCLCVIGRGK